MTIITNPNGTTYDNTQPFNMIDNNGVNLTAQQITDLAAQQAAWAAAAAAAPPPVPDLATQLAAALIANGTLQTTDLQATTLAQVNTSLTAANLPTIAVTAQPTNPANPAQG